MQELHSYILAGGQSARFAHESKGLKQLANKCLIEYVIESLSQQARSITINSRAEDIEAYQKLSRRWLPQQNIKLIPDARPPYSGPLAGLYSCMQDLRLNPEKHWLLLSACDTPFIPKNLAALLLTHRGGAPAACIRHRGHLQPTFSIWHKDLWPLLEDAVMNQGIAGFKSFIDYIKAHSITTAVVDYPEGCPDDTLKAEPFFNINTQDDLDRAHELLLYV